MNKETHTIKDFMGIFPNAASKEFCEDLIKWFEHNNKEGIGGGKKTLSRQQIEKNVSKTSKDSEIFGVECNTLSFFSKKPAIKKLGFAKMIKKPRIEFEKNEENVQGSTRGREPYTPYLVERGQSGSQLSVHMRFHELRQGFFCIPVAAR